MKQTRLTFNRYVMAVCKYAYLEYDFGLNNKSALFQLNREAIDHLGECWTSFVSIPDAANYVAKKMKES
jgi:hypothetical protein